MGFRGVFQRVERRVGKRLGRLGVGTKKFGDSELSEPHGPASRVLLGFCGQDSSCTNRLNPNASEIMGEEFSQNLAVPPRPTWTWCGNHEK